MFAAIAQLPLSVLAVSVVAEPRRESSDVERAATFVRPVEVVENQFAGIATSAAGAASYSRVQARAAPRPRCRTTIPANDVEAGLRAALTCIICTELFHEPVTAACGAHSFCRECLAKWVLKSPMCPVCRAVLPARALVVNVGLQDAVEALSSRYAARDLRK